jgi:hypothetical protein
MHRNAINTLLKKMSKKILLPLFIAGILFSSCSSTGCYDNMNVLVYCNFYQFSDKAAVSVDSITVWGVGSDSLIYDNETLNQLALELNPKSEETQYVIQAVQNGYTSIDTLSLYYTNQPWFQSMDCGCRVNSTLDSCKTEGSIVQSTVIVNPKVNINQTKNVILYL